MPEKLKRLMHDGLYFSLTMFFFVVFHFELLFLFFSLLLFRLIR